MWSFIFAISNFKGCVLLSVDFQTLTTLSSLSISKIITLIFTIILKHHDHISYQNLAWETIFCSIIPGFYWLFALLVLILIEVCQSHHQQPCLLQACLRTDELLFHGVILKILLKVKFCIKTSYSKSFVSYLYSLNPC